MAESDVVLTDYGLAVECVVFAWLADRATPIGRWSAVLFAAIAVASAAGGTAHGFDAGARVLWRFAMLGTGLVAFAAWGAGSCFVASSRLARTIVGMAALELAAYAAAIAGGAETFRFAIANYVAASTLLLGGFVVAAHRKHRSAIAGVAGIGGTVAGAWMQQARVALPALGLDHNALFHVVQGVALAFTFGGFRGLERRTA